MLLVHVIWHCLPKLGNSHIHSHDTKPGKSCAGMILQLLSPGVDVVSFQRFNVPTGRGFPLIDGKEVKPSNSLNTPPKSEGEGKSGVTPARSRRCNREVLLHGTPLSASAESERGAWEGRRRTMIRKPEDLP